MAKVIAKLRVIFRGLWSKLGLGFIGLLAYVVRAQQRARAYVMGPRLVPALCHSVVLMTLNLLQKSCPSARDLLFWQETNIELFQELKLLNKKIAWN